MPNKTHSEETLAQYKKEIDAVIKNAFYDAGWAIYFPDTIPDIYQFLNINETDEAIRNEIKQYIKDSWEITRSNTSQLTTEMAFVDTYLNSSLADKSEKDWSRLQSISPLAKEYMYERSIGFYPDAMSIKTLKNNKHAKNHTEIQIRDHLHHMLNTNNIPLPKDFKRPLDSDSEAESDADWQPARKKSRR